MREVAAVARVSIKTVSRVVNKEHGVSPEREARVKRAMRQLKYQHNTMASTLRRADQRTALIGFLADDAANPFAAELYRAIENVSREHQTLVLFCSDDEDLEAEKRTIASLAERRIDGLVLFPASRESPGLEPLIQLQRPVVSVDRPLNAEKVDSVTVDNRDAVHRAVRHLADRGHRKIGFLGDIETIWTASERYLGYVEGLAQCQAMLNPEWVCQDLRTHTAALQAAEKMLTLSNRPTAFISARNVITTGLVDALQRTGLSDRIAVIGFDDFPSAALLQPRITVIAQNAMAIGRTAASMLFERLAGYDGPARHVTMPTTLIVRGSGEINAHD